MITTRIIRENIIWAFMKGPQGVSFIYIYMRALGDLKQLLLAADDQGSKDDVIRREWEFKRWFWSFIEEAVPYHTKEIYVFRSELQNYDIDLVLKTLKGLGVKIIVKEDM